MMKDDPRLTSTSTIYAVSLVHGHNHNWNQFTIKQTTVQSNSKSIINETIITK